MGRQRLETEAEVDDLRSATQAPPPSPGLRLTKQLKCGPSSLVGERHRGMSGLPSAT